MQRGFLRTFLRKGSLDTEHNISENYHSDLSFFYFVISPKYTFKGKK